MHQFRPAIGCSLNGWVSAQLSHPGPLENAPVRTLQGSHCRFNSSVPFERMQKRNQSARDTTVNARAIICWKSSMQSRNSFAEDFMFHILLWLEFKHMSRTEEKNTELEMTLAKQRCDNGRWEQTSHSLLWKRKDCCYMLIWRNTIILIDTVIYKAFEIGSVSTTLTTLLETVLHIAHFKSFISFKFLYLSVLIFVLVLLNCLSGGPIIVLKCSYLLALKGII